MQRQVKKCIKQILKIALFKKRFLRDYRRTQRSIQGVGVFDIILTILEIDTCIYVIYTVERRQYEIEWNTIIIS